MDYNQKVIDYRTARNALAHARIARGFYPVVVPASDKLSLEDFSKNRGRSKGRGRGRGSSKGRGSKGRGKSRGKSSSSAPSPPRPHSAARPRTQRKRTFRDAQKPAKSEPVCFRCGKKGHYAASCPHEPLSKRKRDDAHFAQVALEMPSEDEFEQTFQTYRRSLWNNDTAAPCDSDH